MVDPLVNKEFSEFGKKMNIIAILTLISFISTILMLFFFWDYLIELIFRIIIIIIIITIGIFFSLASVNIIRVAKILHYQDLKEFTPKFIIGTIIKVVGDQLFALLLGFYFSSYYLHIGVNVVPIGIRNLYGIYYLGNFIRILIIVIVCIIVGSILRYKAWKGLEKFFYSTPLFRADISDAGRSGASNSKIANIFDILFLPIFWIIASILRIYSYFKLTSLRNVGKDPVKPTYQTPTFQPTPISIPSVSTINYCPTCGVPVKPGAQYCTNCGKELK